jgi:hypothetical protein
MASSRTSAKRGERNKVMGTIAVLAVALLVAAATGAYRLFSYGAALFIVANFAAAAIERNDGELNLTPYTWLVVGLAVVFAAGFTLIWLQWHPGVTDYTYLLGLPTSTLSYVVFLWLLPILGALYYALVFPDIGGDDVVDDLMDDVRRAQRGKQFPMSVARTDSDGGDSGDEPGGKSPQADGGNRR